MTPPAPQHHTEKDARWKDPAVLVAIAIAIVLAFVMLGPAIQNPKSRIVGNWNHPDCLGNHWLLVWVAEQLLSFQSILHNPSYYAPFGDAPWLAGNGSEGFLYAPFHALWGWPFGSNIYVFFICIFNGLSAYVLARCVGAGKWASLVCLSAIASSPYVAMELSSGRFSQANLGFFLLSIGLFFSVRKHPTKYNCIGLAIAGALCCLFYFYYAFFLVIIGGVILLVDRFQKKSPPKAFWAAIGIAFVLLLPLFWTFFSNWALIPGSDETVFPHPESRYHSASFRPLDLLAGEARFVALAQSLPILLLLGYGFIARHRKKQQTETWMFFGIGLMAWWLSIGPEGGLYTVIYGVHPFLERFWWPYRHGIILTTFWAVLAAKNMPPVWENKVWPVLLIVCLVPLSFHMQGVSIQAKTSRISEAPAFYTNLAKREGSMILQTPLNPKLGAIQTPLIYQLYHQKRMLNGHAPWVERVRPPKWDAMLQSNSFLSALVNYEAGIASGQVNFDPAHLEELKKKGLRYLIVDQEFYLLSLRKLTQNTRKAIERLFGPPLKNMGGKRVWAFDIHNWSGDNYWVFDEWTWPHQLKTPPTGQALQGRRHPSTLFPPQRNKAN